MWHQAQGAERFDEYDRGKTGFLQAVGNGEKQTIGLEQPMDAGTACRRVRR